MIDIHQATKHFIKPHTCAGEVNINFTIIISLVMRVQQGTQSTAFYEFAESSMSSCLQCKNGLKIIGLLRCRDNVTVQDFWHKIALRFHPKHVSLSSASTSHPTHVLFSPAHFQLLSFLRFVHQAHRKSTSRSSHSRSYLCFSVTVCLKAPM